VGDPVTLDSNGVMIDGLAGGIARFRGSTGSSRDQVELGPHGWLFTDVELWSPSAEVLRIGDGNNAQALEIDGPASGTIGGTLRLMGAGATNDVDLTNDGGRVRITGTGAVDEALQLGDDAVFFDADLADRIGIKGIIDPTAGGLVFGSAKDTGLYRGGANLLKTDDTFDPASFVETVTNVTLTGGGTATYTVSPSYRWIQIGNLVIFRLFWQVNAAGNGATSLQITTASGPPAPLSSFLAMGDRGGTGATRVLARMGVSGGFLWMLNISSIAAPTTQYTGTELVASNTYHFTGSYFTA
jgi:hypothetical protein